MISDISSHASSCNASQFASGACGEKGTLINTLGGLDAVGFVGALLDEEMVREEFVVDEATEELELRDGESIITSGVSNAGFLLQALSMSAEVNVTKPILMMRGVMNREDSTE